MVSLNTFGGGALANFSILAMGIMPYITASIIVQLLQMDVVPKFTEWAKQGEVGRRKLAQFTRYFTIMLAFIQAFAMSYGFNRMYSGSLIKDEGVTTILIIAIVLTAGTAFLVWLGEQITAKGVGNGISIIIFAGIVAAIPNAVNQVYAQQIEGAGDALFINIVIVVLLLLLAIIAVTVGVIYVQQALRKIPIQYAKRVAGTTQTGGQQTHLPLKVNAAGVIPVIFASAFLMAPQSLVLFFGQNNVTRCYYKSIRLYSTYWYDNLYCFNHCVYILLCIHSSESRECSRQFEKARCVYSGDSSRYQYTKLFN